MNHRVVRQAGGSIKGNDSDWCWYTPSMMSAMLQEQDSRYCSKHYLLVVGAIATAYFLVSASILAIPAFSGQASPVWPAAGIAMAGLILFGFRAWPGVAIGAFLLDYTHSASLLESLGTSAGSLLQAALGVFLLQKAGFNLALIRLRDAIALVILAAVIATTVNATWTISFLLLLGDISPEAFLQHWGTFWLGDSMGVLIMTPLIILALQPRSLKSVALHDGVERFAWLVLLLSVCFCIFYPVLPPTLTQYPIEYLPFPLLIWAILRFGQFFAVLGSGIVSAMAISGALVGGGPFIAQAVGIHTSPIFPLQAFMGVTAATTLVLATAVRQQRRTQELLRRSEASLSNAQRIAQVGHWDFDPVSGQWYASAELYRLLGLEATADPTMPLKARLVQAVHPADRDRISTLLDEAIFLGRSYVADYRIVLPDGQERYVVEQVDVGSECVTGTIQDVTERVCAEAALRESEEKFSKAFGFSPDAITISTLAEGLIIDVNDRFLELTGYTRAEVIGHSVHELKLWARNQDREWLVEQLRQHQSVRNKEFEFCTQFGKSAFALVSAELVPLKGETYLLLVARDITEQKRADEQLRLSNERDRLLGEVALHIRQTLDLQDMLNTTVTEVRQLLQAGRVFITRFDEEEKGTIVAESVLPEFNSLMGELVDEGVYQDICNVFEQFPVVAIHDMTNLDDFPCLSFLEECVQRHQVRAALGVPIIVNGVLYGILVAHHCTSPRRWQPFEMELLERLATQVAIAIQQGELYTQVQQLNTTLEQQVRDRTVQLEQKMTELQELNQLRDVFLHAVSHDLRTTVMGNLMILRNLQSQHQDPVYLSRNILDRMVQAGECQLNKLNSLQEAYVLKTQGVELDRDFFSLPPLVEWAIADLKPLIEKNRATITVHSPDSSASVWADQSQIQRVLKHILANALIHNPPGVNIAIHLEARADFVTCTVEDDGIGMSSELCDRLFKLCMGSPNSPQLTGISLGLYLCRQIITAHGGAIGVSSLPQHGTSLWFSLPTSIQVATPDASELPTHLHQPQPTAN